MKKDSKKVNVKFKPKHGVKTNYKWCFIITFITMMLSLFMNIISNIMTNSLSLGWAFFILCVIVFVGIFCDILGTAVISSDIILFTSMASDRVRGSKEAIFLVKNADVISNIFNDVIGDTCGIISGATLGAIFLKLTIANENVWYIIVGSIIAAITVGGKALGKGYAIRNCSKIVYRLAKIMSIFNYKNFVRKSK